jgi:hypothetical protein
MERGRYLFHTVKPPGLGRRLDRPMGKKLLGNTCSREIYLAVGEEIPRRLEKTCKVYQKSRLDQKLREKL